MASASQAMINHYPKGT